MKNYIFIGVLALAIFIVAILISGTIVTFTWNYTIPIIFGLTKITWLQGTALTILVWTLFGNSITTTRVNK